LYYLPEQKSTLGIIFRSLFSRFSNRNAAKSGLRAFEIHVLGGFWGDLLETWAKEMAEEDEVVREEYDFVKQKMVLKRLVLEGKILNPIQFDTYRKKRQEYLQEVLEKAGLIEKFRPDPDKGFQIPLSQKEDIKFLLRQYASPVSRKIRKNKSKEITTAEAAATNAAILDFIHQKKPSSIHAKETATAYALSELQSREAFDEVEKILLKLIADDLSQVKSKPVSLTGPKTKLSARDAFVGKKLRIANDSDAAYLMYFYYSMLRQQSTLWNEIVDEVAELRNEEVLEILTPHDNDSYDQESIENETEPSPENYRFRDIKEVIIDAQLRVFQNRVEKSRLRDPDLSPEEIKVVEDLLKSRI